MSSPDELLVVGRITSVFGVRGWVKIHSYADKPENIFDYQPWRIKVGGAERLLQVDEWRDQGGKLVAHISGIDDRDVAREVCQQDIFIDKSLLPKLEAGEFYWDQLIGLEVVTRHSGAEQVLGKVASLLETGANDVLVVRGEATGEATQERLIPYAPQYVLEIDLQNGRMLVDWDPDF